MKQMKYLLLILAVLMLTGCGKPEPTETTGSALEPTYSIEETASLLEGVELTLPDFIDRQCVSDTRDYFYKDGQVVGGIELVEPVDGMDLDAYAQLALAVTRAVYDTEYDYIAEGEVISKALVSVSSREGREFYHYFFSGAQGDYDVWMDYDVLDSRDMRSCLKTLHADGLDNPQDRITVNAEVPLLNLRAAMPEGITRQPTRTTRDLFYCGETLAGGIEQFAPSQDPDALGQAAAELARELYGGEFDYTVTECESEPGIIAVATDSESVHLVHYIRTVGEECYDIWADTAVIPEENALGIAQSCQY